MAVLNPGKVSFTGLGLGPVRSPLLGVSRLITLPDCSIRRSAGQWSFAPLRSFSQLVASFIGRYRQGIHRMLLLS